MNEYYIGIDSGSTMCKSALMKGGKVVDLFAAKTGWKPSLSAKESLSFLLNKHRINPSETIVCATGYGRGSVDFADFAITEITCHALGADYLSKGLDGQDVSGITPEKKSVLNNENICEHTIPCAAKKADSVCGVIDIGGQDSKAILMQGGRVLNFLMNDKCAAGTGRFLQMACATMDIEIARIDEFAHPSEAERINSMCSVFAESEIISALSEGRDRGKILSGVLCSIAQKIAQLTGKLGGGSSADCNGAFFMTGGLSQSARLRAELSLATGQKIVTHKDAVFAGAIGACLYSKNKAI